MAIRFPAVPDKDGIVRIRCGDDVLEIELMQPTSAVSRGTTAPPDDPDPTEIIVVGLRGGREGLLPFSLMSEGKLDLDGLMLALNQRFEDPAMVDPQTVMLMGPEVDVHAMSALGRRLAELGRDIRLAVAFGASAQQAYSASAGG